MKSKQKGRNLSLFIIILECFGASCTEDHLITKYCENPTVWLIKN